MELRQLETFVTVVRQQSFSRAADTLYLTQPAVSRQIAMLEAELKCRLLDRLGRSIRPTAAGDVLYAYAADILRAAGDAAQAVADVSAGAAGSLNIGVNSSAATYVLPALLSAFRRDHPHVEIRVHTGPSALIAERVRANDVDAGIVTGLPPQAGLVSMALARQETGLVVYPGHPLAERGSSVELRELDGAELILMERGATFRAHVDSLLAQAGVDGRAALELDNVESIKKMIEARLGISLLPLASVQQEADDGRLAPLSLAGAAGAFRAVEFIHRPDKFLSASLRAFLRLAEAELRHSKAEERRRSAAL